MLKFYGYKKCGTSRKGEKFLNDNGIEYEFIDITVNPPSKSELEKIISLCNKPIKKFFNTSGAAYKAGNYKEKLKTMTREEAINELAKNGKLIKRPLITNWEKATVGFDEKEFKETWID